MRTDPATEDLLRELAPQVLGALVRRYGRFDACEDAVQEALLAAALQWPEAGVPDQPRAWLLTVASRRVMDEWRSESARRRREEATAALEIGALASVSVASEEDDTLTLLFLCCHPSLSEPSQVALTLRAVGGLTTGEIASAFLVPETTMGQRISRAKASIKQSELGFALPPADERDERLGRRAARPVPGLQRGLHRQFGRRPPAHGPHDRGDPARAPARHAWSRTRARPPACSP